MAPPGAPACVGTAGPAAPLRGPKLGWTEFVYGLQFFFPKFQTYLFGGLASTNYFLNKPVDSDVYKQCAALYSFNAFPVVLLMFLFVFFAIAALHLSFTFAFYILAAIMNTLRALGYLYADARLLDCAALGRLAAPLLVPALGSRGRRRRGWRVPAAGGDGKGCAESWPVSLSPRARCTSAATAAGSIGSLRRCERPRCCHEEHHHVLVAPRPRARCAPRAGAAAASHACSSLHGAATALRPMKVLVVPLDVAAPSVAARAVAWSRKCRPCCR